MNEKYRVSFKINKKLKLTILFSNTREWPAPKVNMPTEFTMGHLLFLEKLHSNSIKQQHSKCIRQSLNWVISKICPHLPVNTSYHSFPVLTRMRSLCISEIPALSNEGIRGKKDRVQNFEK